MSKNLTLALQIKADVNQAQQAIQQLKNDVQNTANTVANAEQKQQQSHKQTSQAVEKQADVVEQLADNVDDLAQAEQKATQQTERMGDAIDDNVQSTQRNIDINQRMEQSLKSLTPHFMALIGLSGGLMTATMDVLEKSSQLKNLSTISGMNVEQFQYYAVGAKSVGVEMDKLSDIFKDTRDKVGDFLATGGGELKDFFDDIAPKVGVTAEQFRGLSGADALQLYVDSLRKANLSENEMIFYMESIADEASALLPLLNQGGEGFRKYGEQAKQAGAILSQSTVEDALKAKSAISDFQTQMQGVGNTMVVNLIPALQFVSQHFDVLVKAGIIVASVFAGRMTATFIATTVEMIKLQAQTMMTAVAQARLGEVSLLTATRLNALAVASRLLTASGGLIGLGVAVASIIAGFLLMRKSSDQVSTSLDEQKKSVSELKQEYNQLSESQKRVKQQEQIAKVGELTDAYNKQAQAMRALVAEAHLRSTSSSEEKKKIDSLYQSYRDGKISAEQLANEMSKMSSVSQELKNKIDQQAGSTTTAKAKMDEANNVLATYQGKAVQATSATSGLEKGLNNVANTAENAKDKIANLSREYRDLIKQTEDDLQQLTIANNLIKQGYDAEVAKELAKAYQVSDGNLTAEHASMILQRKKLQDEQEKLTKKDELQKSSSSQKSTAPRVVGIVGDTGIGDTHLDIRRGDGKKPTQADLDRFRAGGKKLTDYHMSSGYGHRNINVEGASKFHKGLDFVIAKGTEVTTTVPVKDVKKWWDVKGGGYVSTITFEDGLVMKLLHQDPSMQQKVAGGASRGSSSNSKTSSPKNEPKYQYKADELVALKRVQGLIYGGSGLDKLAEKHGVPAHILAGLMMQESKGIQNAKSHTGAIGYFQTTSAYRKDMKMSVADSYDLQKSGAKAIEFLAESYRQFGNWEDAIRSYNAGRGGANQFAKTGRVTGSDARNREVREYNGRVEKWKTWFDGRADDTSGVSSKDNIAFVQAELDRQKQELERLKQQQQLQDDVRYEFASEPEKAKIDRDKKLERLNSAGLPEEERAKFALQIEQEYQDKISQRPEKLKAVYDMAKQEEQKYLSSTMSEYDKQLHDIEHQFDDFLAKIAEARQVTNDPQHLKDFDDMEHKIRVIIDKEKLKAEYEHAMSELDKMQAEKQQKIDILQQRYDSSNMTAHEFHTQKTAIDEDFNPRLKDMATNAQHLAHQLNDAFSVEKLNLFIAGLNQAQTSFQQFLPTAEQLNDRITNGLTDAFFAFADGTKSAEQAFREFASSFFREIAQMILKQMIFNAISNAGKAGGGGWGGAIAGVIGSAFGGKGYSSGGYTGKGGKYEPAGIVHRDEFVIRKEMTNQVGAKEFLANFNRYGMNAIKGLQGYSSGGLVGASVPQIFAPNIQAPKLSSPSEKIAQSTSFNANQNFYLVDDPSRILDTLNSSQGQENLVVMMSRDPEKFKTALKIG